MRKSIGELLDNPTHFLHWLHGETARFAAVNAIVKLDLLRHIGRTPVPADTLAARGKLDAGLVRRLCEYLAAEGVLGIDDAGHFFSTPRSDQLLDKVDVMVHTASWARAAGMHLHEAIAQGRTAYEMHFGKPVFEHLKEHPDLAAIFGRAMSFTTAIAEAHLFASHRFHPFKLAVDVGGNHGSLLLRLLSEHPAARGILFDLPETCAQAQHPVSASACADRVEIVGGSFFESVPAGGDLYLLKQVLHDWNDEECSGILRKVREGIIPGGRVAVIERVIPDDYQPHTGFDFDMLMMIWTTGRERRLAEFKQLFADCGFTFDRFTENPDGMGVIEAVAD